MPNSNPKNRHRPKLLSLLAAALLITACSQRPDTLDSSDGWVSLFDGESFAGWEMKSEIAERIWSIKDGVIDCSPFQGGKDDKHLWSTNEYRDFELHVEWRIKELKGIYNTPTVLPDGSYLLDANGERVINPSPGADSGIYLRGSNKSQINIWAWDIGSGEVYGYRHNQKDPEIRAGVTPKTKADKPIGEWNAFHITMKGDRLTVVLNGETVLNKARLPDVPESGPIALQHHGGYNEEQGVWNGASSLVQFRNIKIKEL
ncbi:MAG TPA: DUF1080 domain-containing protein [Opitutae bacterium]|nr:DUF1080 domain-containing protein [Opitutae bacterium]